MEQYSNSPKNMGKVNRFFVANGMSELRDFTGRNISPFSNMDGEIDSNLEYSPANGVKKIKKRKPTKSKKTWEKVMDYTPLGMAKKGIDNYTSNESKSRREKRRQDRLALKKTQAQTQQEIAKSLSQPSAIDQEMLKAVQETNPETPALTPPTDGNTGMSKTTKTILIVSGVLVAVTATILVIRKIRKQ